jgi:rod shape determining protein RodA
MGAQRWIRIAFIQFQPSEIMRIALVLALARFFSDTEKVTSVRSWALAVVIVLTPVLVTIEQPDLGTALSLLIGGGAIFFFAGVSWKFFVPVAATSIACLPVFWHFLRDYQRKRVITFLAPERDPLGSGYHIIQSKIAIGSGGFWGKGFMRGTQGALDFLPEKHTDFIFTLLNEESGFIGGITLIALYYCLILLNILLSIRTRNMFCRLTIVGMTISFALYSLVNIAMVTGVLPVVGIPLPLVSYGGTSMVTLLIGQGLIFAAAFYKTKVRVIQTAN